MCYNTSNIEFCIKRAFVIMWCETCKIETPELSCPAADPPGRRFAVKKVNWDLTEAVALLGLYLEEGRTPSVSEEKLLLLSRMLNCRARDLGLEVDDKFRNLTGLKMQLQCVHFMCTNGEHGLSAPAKIFYQAYDLLQSDPQAFQNTKDQFYRHYLPQGSCR